MRLLDSVPSRLVPNPTFQGAGLTAANYSKSPSR